MSIFKVQKELIELSSLELHPSRSYVSSSATIGETSWGQAHGLTGSGGVTGSLGVIARPSKCFKDFPATLGMPELDTDTEAGTGFTVTTEPFWEIEDYVGGSPYDFAEMIKRSYTGGVLPAGANIFNKMAAYAGYPASIRSPSDPIGSDGERASDQGVVNSRKEQQRNKVKKEITLFRPPYRDQNLGQGKPSLEGSSASENKYIGTRGTTVMSPSGSNRLVKDYIRKVLMPTNAQRYTVSQYAYTNYHTLNFFTGSGLPASACLIYNNSTGAIPPLSAPHGTLWPKAATIPVPRGGWNPTKLLTMYENPLDSNEPASLQAGRGPYTPTASFTFEFYINPRYTNGSTEQSSGEFIHPFRAGTILHMPTIFAVSLVSGSSTGPDGKVDGYRIMLQLSHSAEISPHEIVLTSSANTVNNSIGKHDLIFLSDDNALKRNHWHYIGIRWGTNAINDGTGSFIIDGEEKGTFCIPSASIAQPLPVAFTNASTGVPSDRSGFPDLPDIATRLVRRTNIPAALDPDSNGSVSGADAFQVPDPDILVVGNFYEGPGTGSLCSSVHKLYNFFNVENRLSEGVVPVRHRNWTSTSWHAAMKEGVRPTLDPPRSGPGTSAAFKTAADITVDATGREVPPSGNWPASGYRFRNPLNAEIHEIKIYDKYRNLEEIITGSMFGPNIQLELSESFNKYEDPEVTDTSAVPSAKIIGKKCVGKAVPEDNHLLFYLPILFVKESPPRTFLLNCVESFKKDVDSTAESEGNWTPAASTTRGRSGDDEYLFPESPGTSAAPETSGSVLSNNSGTMLGRPFNAGLSLNVDASIINLENFCREFVAGSPFIPRSPEGSHVINAGDGVTYDFCVNSGYGYNRGNYPRVMFMTASSAGLYDASFSRWGMNIGRVNSMRAEHQYLQDEGIIAAAAIRDYYKPGATSHTTPSYIDGKFLTNVSGALDHFYGTGSMVKRDLATIPNDNGRFKPNFAWLLSSSLLDVLTDVEFTNDSWTSRDPEWYSPMNVFVDDTGKLDLSLIGLQNLFDAKPQMEDSLSRGANLPSLGGFERTANGIDLGTTILTGTCNWSYGLSDNSLATSRASDPHTRPSDHSDGYRDWVSPDNPDGIAIDFELNEKVKYLGALGERIEDLNNCVIEPSFDFWVYQTTGDPSSNEVVIMNISNLYYGQKVAESSFVIKDPFITGSRGKVQITLRDDGAGGLYRADCATKQATWANVGNIFYSEGLGIIKSPQLANFGKDYFETSFAGEQKLHVMTVNAFAPSNAVNSSSNPAYKILSATNNANDTAPEFTYVTSINFHDDNLNVIMRANLAQPILKRWVEEYLFKVKMDF